MPYLGLADMHKLHLKSTSEQVYDYLLQAIFERELQSGEKLVIENIARQLGTSTTPVRDAFKKLELQGLLEVRPRSGSYVKMPTAKEIEDVFQLRLILEQAAIEQCGAPLDPHVSVQIEGALNQAGHSGEVADFIGSDEMLHEAILKCLDNAEVFGVTRLIWIKMRLFRIVCGQDMDFDLNALDEHRKILLALKSADKSALKNLVTMHILKVQKKTIMSFMRLK